MAQDPEIEMLRLIAELPTADGEDKDVDAARIMLRALGVQFNQKIGNAGPVAAAGDEKSGVRTLFDNVVNTAVDVSLPLAGVLVAAAPVLVASGAVTAGAGTVIGGTAAAAAAGLGVVAANRGRISDFADSVIG